MRGERVHLDRGPVRELTATIPATFTFRARNPARSLPVGGSHAILVPMTGAPLLRDLDDVRRWPALADLQMLHKLAHMSPSLHSTAHHIVEPLDLSVSHRHLHATHSSMRHSDKTFTGMTTSPRNAEDVMEMCALPFGEAAMEEAPIVTGNRDGNSPLVRDEVMLGALRALRAFRRRNRPVLRSPFVLGGASTPAPVAPAVAQVRAEALPALACAQVVRRGCPAICGHHLSTVPMRSGAPVAGTPEISLVNLMIGRMARHRGVPWRTSSTLGGARTFDAQAGHESATTMSAVLHAGANHVWHSVGWNEAGMHCSVATFVVDAEACAMGRRLAEGVRWDDVDEALAVRDAGPGGHCLGHPHTLGNSERAFPMPQLLDNTSVEQWQAEGSVEITARAPAHARRLLGEHEEPRLDAGVDEALRDHMARRTREIPAADALDNEH